MFTLSGKCTKELPLNLPDVELSLSSTGLAIAPTNEQVFQLNESDTIEFEWSISPTSLGKHHIVFEYPAIQSSLTRLNSDDTEYIDYLNKRLDPRNPNTVEIRAVETIDVQKSIINIFTFIGWLIMGFLGCLASGLNICERFKSYLNSSGKDEQKESEEVE